MVLGVHPHASQRTVTALWSRAHARMRRMCSIGRLASVRAAHTDPPKNTACYETQRERWMLTHIHTQRGMAQEGRAAVYHANTHIQAKVYIHTQRHTHTHTHRGARHVRVASQ
jgi:hypothetical protein